MKLCIITFTMVVAGAFAEEVGICGQWFAEDATHVCPAGSVARDVEDPYPAQIPEGTSKFSTAVGECCGDKCALFSAKVTCPTGTELLGPQLVFQRLTSLSEQEWVDECCALTCESAAVSATCEADEMLKTMNQCANDGECKQAAECCEKKTCKNDPDNAKYEVNCAIEGWFDDTCGKGTEDCKVLCDIQTLSAQALQACADCASLQGPLCFGCLDCTVDHHDLANQIDGWTPLIDTTPTEPPAEEAAFAGADKAAAASGSVLLLSAVLTAML